jgi:serine/threonine-protein kinase
MSGPSMNKDAWLARLTAALAERYTVERQIGQGGMATVYSAQDLKHHRAVAIKVLRPELAATIGPERFLREIELSAQFQHPHIVPLYDSGSADGVLYYVMPLVEGESLRDRISRDGKLAFEESVRLTREVASALAYAHGHGVVHRDIKPENIMLSGGHAVVADFGIARALNVAAEGQQLTGLGFAIGTPAYMSPEQATAGEVDARSDQYSLACVFYEMTTGTAPFRGATVQAVLSQSLTGARPKLSKVNREAPPEADGAVQRAMASEPSKRFQSVQDFAAALEHASGGGTGAMAERRRLRRLAFGLPIVFAALALGFVLFGPRRTGPVVQGAETIAVLPFSASGAGVELMGEGMVDLLSTNLNSVGGIRAVEPRTVMARVKKAGLGNGIDLDAALRIARDVKAQAALLGSIVATGSQVRVSADLYGQDGKSLAHAQVDGAADSVLSLVDGLSLELVREIWRSKEPLPSLRVSGLTTNSLAAMREYLVGEQYYRRLVWDSAAAAFERATQQDSTFALAHLRLAAAIGWTGGLGDPKSRAASELAVRYASRLPPREKSIVTAYNLFTHGDLAATDSMRSYTARYPDDVDGWFLLGESLYHTRHIVPYDPATVRAPFDRVLALDSSLSPAAIHPLELALIYRDSVNYRPYLNILAKSGNEAERLAYTGGGELVFGRGSIDSTTARAMAQFQGSMLGFTSTVTEPGTTSDSIMNRWDRWGRMLLVTPQASMQFTMGRGLTLASLGRYAESRALADSLLKAGRQEAYGIMLWPSVAGFGPPDDNRDKVDQVLKAPRTNPFLVQNQVMVMINRGEIAAARKVLDSLIAHPSNQVPPQLYDLFSATRAWTGILQGDTAGNLSTLRTGLIKVGGWNKFFSSPLRLQYAAILTRRPETREEGLRMLQYSFDIDLGYAPLVLYAQGQAYEAAGDRAKAADAYAMFLKLWDKGDPEASTRVAEVKEALVRTTGEPKSN